MQHNTEQQQAGRRWLRWLALAGVVILVGGGLLALDLANQGLAWQFFWSQTGEEEPLAQVRGMIEWAGNLIRPQPVNAGVIPIDHRQYNPYGINTFLQNEPDPAKVAEQLRLIGAAGFAWIRQELVWEDIEVDGRGQYTDSRNDLTGDGVPDTVDSWLKYDYIVAQAAANGIELQARLSNPPDWALDGADPTGLALPVDVQDYVNFAVAAATHYKGKIRAYQVWNEPNIFPEWGAFADGSPRPVDPEAYTDLLCRTYAALKAVDPEIIVISGALAPTNPLWYRDLNDFVYLQRMYDAGAGACFDVLSMQGYGLNSGPTDRRMRPTTVNFGRNQYVRELMVANGDAHKPIWISEAAWNYVPSEAEYPEPIEARYNYGQVTPEQAARYMPLAYARARQEWAWVGVMNYWFFTLEDDSRKNQSWYYFRMAEPDYSDVKPTYTTLPIYDAMQTYIASHPRILYPAVHQLDQHWLVTYTDDETAVVKADGAQFDEAITTRAIQFTAHGTDLRLRWQGGSLLLTVDGKPLPLIVEPAGDWRTTTLVQTLLPETHTYSLTSEAALMLDAVTVDDRRFTNLYPLVAGIGVLVGMTGLALGVGLRERSRRAGGQRLV